MYQPIWCASRTCNRLWCEICVVSAYAAWLEAPFNQGISRDFSKASNLLASFSASILYSLLLIRWCRSITLAALISGCCSIADFSICKLITGELSAMASECSGRTRFLRLVDSLVTTPRVGFLSVEGFVLGPGLFTAALFHCPSISCVFPGQ
jgi:hypothetical protein